MAKKKKKSRLKKILKKLGKVAMLGGAAYGASKLFGGRNKGNVLNTAASEDANIGVTHSALADSAPVIRKDVLPEPKPVIIPPVSGGGGIHAGKPKTLHLQKMARAHLPKGPPGWDNPYQAPVRPRGRLHSNFMKKGGRVTGIAKRGFGRALMKGKK